MSNLATPEQVPEHLHNFIEDRLTEDEKVVLNISKEKVFPATPFVFLFVDNFEKICEKHRLTAFEIRTVMKLIQKMQFGNQVSLTQAAIASEMNAPRQQVNRVFKRLHDTGIMIDDEHGNTFINLELFWRGKFSNADREFKKQYALSQQRNRDLQNPTTAPFDFTKKKERARKAKDAAAAGEKKFKHPGLFDEADTTA